MTSNLFTTRLLITLVIPLVGVSCQIDKNKKNGLVRYEVTSENSIIPLSKFADAVSLIPLREDSNFFISRVNKIFYSENHIVVVDKVLTKTIFIYSNEGIPLSKINKLGKGPGEYVGIADVSVCNDSVIILYDNFQKKLIWYGFNGIFIKEKPLGLIIDELAAIDQDNIVFHCLQENPIMNSKEFFNPGILLLDNKEEIVQLKSLGKEGSLIGVSPGLYGISDHIYLCSQFVDTIFTVGRSVGSSFLIDFGDNKAPKKYYNLRISQFDQNMFSGIKFVTGKHNFLLDDDFIFLGFTVGDKMNYWIKNGTRNLSGIGFENDINGIKFSTPYTKFDDYLIALTTTEEVSAFYERTNMMADVADDKLKATIAGQIASNNSNPLIVKIKLK